MPEMILVDSKSVEAIGYEIGALELHVRFLKSGETYAYYAVEEWRYQELQQADSKGQYPELHREIGGANAEDRRDA